LGEWRSARIDAASSMWSWNGSSRLSVALARERLCRLDVGRGLLPYHVGLGREQTLLLGGQALEVVEAPVDQRAVRDEPFGGGRVVLLDGGLAQVVGLHQEVPDLLDALGLLDGLLAELLEGGDGEAEGDQSGPGDRRDRQQHGRQRQPQAAGDRRPWFRNLAHRALLGRWQAKPWKLRVVAVGRMGDRAAVHRCSSSIAFRSTSAIVGGRAWTQE
jgi:hypothetical protein